MQDIRDYAEQTRKSLEGAVVEFRQHLRDVRSKAKPLRMELVTAADTEWLKAPAVEEVIGFLCGIGFQSAGAVMAQRNAKIAMAGFAAPDHAAYASVPNAGTRAFVSFVSEFADGSVFECSNMPVAFEPPYPAWVTHRRRVGSTAADLWACFLQQRPVKAVVPANPGVFASASTEQMFRYRAWMAERGGETRDEIAARYLTAGRLPAGEEGQNLLDQLRSNEVEQSMCNWWCLQREAPYPLSSVIDSLVIIHDEMSPQRLATAYWCCTGDYKVRAADFLEGRPRDSFARVVASRANGLRKILQKSTPLEADFYVSQ